MSEPFPQAFHDAGLDVIHFKRFNFEFNATHQLSLYSFLEEQLILTKLLIPGYINY